MNIISLRKYVIFEIFEIFQDIRFLTPSKRILNVFLSDNPYHHTPLAENKEAYQNRIFQEHPPPKAAYFRPKAAYFSVPLHVASYLQSANNKWKAQVTATATSPPLGGVDAKLVLRTGWATADGAAKTQKVLISKPIPNHIPNPFPTTSQPPSKIPNLSFWG